jgi:hypothetical protein
LRQRTNPLAREGADIDAGGQMGKWVTA